MEIALLHNYYTEKHLNEVKAEMVKRGAPVIRAIWSECYGMWLAVEGCHRIRAAKELGLTPIINDISNNNTVTIQEYGKVKVSVLAQELNDQAWKVEAISF